LRRSSYSEATAQQIDEEVKSIINGCYDRAKQVITLHRDKLEMIAKALLEYETLEGKQVEEIVRHGTFTAPIRPPKDPGHMMGAPAGTPLPETPTKSAPPPLPGLGTPAPAAA
jgi:cell division protease FtsH